LGFAVSRLAGPPTSWVGKGACKKSGQCEEASRRKQDGKVRRHRIAVEGGGRREGNRSIEGGAAPAKGTLNTSEADKAMQKQKGDRPDLAAGLSVSSRLLTL
jgi:hypothetical protein